MIKITDIFSLPRKLASRFLRWIGHPLTAVALERIDNMGVALTALLEHALHSEKRSRQATAVLERVEQRLREVSVANGEIRTELNDARMRIESLAPSNINIVDSAAYASTNPETGLFCHLYSALGDRTVLDVGAHHGDFAETLLETGFRMILCEPRSSTFRALKARLGDHPGVHLLNLAIGRECGSGTLRIAQSEPDCENFRDASVFDSLQDHPLPTGLRYAAEEPVEINSIANLIESGDVPANLSIVKIDTEGFDLEVIRGMGTHRFPVVMAEYWDPATPFVDESAPLYTAREIVHEMKERGYNWHIVVYRVWGNPRVFFYSNMNDSVFDSWGNIVFFSSFELFRKADEWCSAVMQRTIFRPAPGS